MKKLRYLFAAMITGTLLLTASHALTQPLYAATESSNEACETLKDINPDSKGCNAADDDADSLIKLALNLLSMVAGVIAVIMLMVSGFKYITADGDATQISNAKKSLIYAIVGLVVVALAQFIVRFVLSKTLQA
jgi:hypothetical protein